MLHEWADDSFFVWVTGEFGVYLRFYRDVEDGSGALELFCFCGRYGNISVLDKHIDIYVDGGWGRSGCWESYVRFHEIDPHTGIDESICGLDKAKSENRALKRHHHILLILR